MPDGPRSTHWRAVPRGEDMQISRASNRYPVQQKREGMTESFPGPEQRKVVQSRRAGGILQERPTARTRCCLLGLVFDVSRNTSEWTSES